MANENEVGGSELPPDRSATASRDNGGSIVESLSDLLPDTRPRGAPGEGPSILEDSLSISDVGGDSRTVLAQLRTRLLDLTLTNRLLNFKHGPRTVRVIDELPDQLFARLSNGDELEFLPISEPPPKHALSAQVAHSGTKQDRQKAAEAYARELGFKTEFELPLPCNDTSPAYHNDSAIQTFSFRANLSGRCVPLPATLDRPSRRRAATFFI